MLVNLLLLKLLFLFNITPVDTTPVITDETYCNARFEYCVDYKDHFFDAIERSDNGDGVLLFNTDSKIRMIVSGTYNVMDYSASDLVDDYLNNLRKETGRNVQFLNEEETDHGKRALYKTTKAFHYVQYVISENAYASTVLIIPQQNRKQLNDMKEQIKLYLKSSISDDI